MRHGQSIIEILIVVGMAAIVLPALLTGLVTSRSGRAQYTQRLEATTLLKEAGEAVRTIRDGGWTTLVAYGNGTFHPESSGTDWSLEPGSETLANGFMRQIDIIEVRRDVSGTIVSSGGNVDPSTRKVMVMVSWSQPYQSSISSTMYLTRYLDNASYTETTQTQFNAGTKGGVVVQASAPNPTPTPDDGEMILASGGHSNWCAPSVDQNTLNLPKNGVGKAISAIQGQAFAGTGENSSGVSFANITITDTFPPVPTIGGTFDGYKTNGIFGEANYAYLATDTNSKEVVIIDLTQISGGKYNEAGYFDAPGNGNGNSIFVAGNTGYMTVDNKLYNFDLSSKSGSRPALDSNGVVVSLFGTSKKVYVMGSYAYVAISNYGLIELTIVDISNPTNLQVVGWADVNGESGQEVYVNGDGTRAYLTTNASSSKREFFIIDVSAKTGSRPTLGNYEANGMSPKGVTLVPGNRAILVGSGGEEYQVIDISNESNPIRCGGVDVNIAINGVSSVLEADNDAYSYIISDSDPEFRIVEGGPGGGYTSSGIFESATFDPGYQTANNRFLSSYAKPEGTGVEFQISMANLVAENCPASGSYTFVGPSGTDSDWFSPTSGVSVPFPLTNYLNYANPGQCMRYKVKFSTLIGTNTPVLYDFTINYSP